MADRQDLIDNILLNSDVTSKFKTTEVHNVELIELDEGNLLSFNENKPDSKIWRANKETALLNGARDATQALFNALWKLPVEQIDGSYTVKLPDQKTWIPREKPVPKKKPPTKWEEYAKTKGILNKKKSRMVWDEASQQYKPRWGYKRANDNTKDWVIEIPDNKDPYEDHFAKRKEVKRERIAKNELQRLRNIARTKKGKVPGVGLTPTEQPSKDHLAKALAVAQRSNASIGKFTERLPKEKPSKHTGKKRKFEQSIGNLKTEKEGQLELLSIGVKKVPKINVSKAANIALRSDEQERAKEKQSKKTPKKQKGRNMGNKLNMSKKGTTKGKKGKR